MVLTTPAEILWNSLYNCNPPAYIPTPKAPSKKAVPLVNSRLAITLDEPQPCAICGRPVKDGFATYTPRAKEVEAAGKPTEGVKYVGVVSGSYGEHYFLAYPTSRIVCDRCEAVFRQNMSFVSAVVASMKECTFVRGKDVINKDPSAGIKLGGLWKRIIEDPPEPPFIIAVNRSMTVEGSNPAHFITMATVNYSRDRFVVNLYEKVLPIDRDLMRRFFIDTGLAKRIVANRTASKKEKVLFGLLEDLLFKASEEIRRGRAGADLEKLNEIAPEIAADPVLIQECATAEAIRAIRFLRLSMSAE